MKNFDSMKKINPFLWRLEVEPATDVKEAILEAIQIAQWLNTAAWINITVQFDFNGTVITARGDSDPALLCRDWYDRHK